MSADYELTESVGNPRGRGGCRVQFGEERSGPNEESENSGKDIDRVDDWCRSPRRWLTLRYSESPDSRRSGSRVGCRIRPDDLRGTSDRETVRLGSRSTLGRRESDRAERKDSRDREVSSYYRNADRLRRPRRDPSDPPSDKLGDEIPSRGSRRGDSSRYEWPASPWPDEGRAQVKRMVMKPPNFNGMGSVRTFLAKFDNCARYNRCSDREKLHYLTNALEDPATQVLWDLQPKGAVSYRDLRATLAQVYGSEGQAEVYRAQLKLVRRMKGESLIDLAMEIRRLMVMASPGPTDRTTEIVARDVFLDALDDPELTFQIHAQRPRDLDSAVQIAQYKEAVMRSLPCRSSKPVRAVVQSGNEGKIDAELRDLRAAALVGNSGVER